MVWLVISVIFTLGVSSLCSVLEAVLLSTTSSDVEALKAISLRRGTMLEGFRKNIAETSSAILALNTIANTLGSLVTGSFAARVLGESLWLAFSVAMTLAILFFAEIVPKNLGVFYRHFFQRHGIFLMWVVCRTMFPISWACKHTLRFFLRRQKQVTDDANKEILLLAEKGAHEGTLNTSEYRLIVNALSLDATPIRQVMTPRTVVMALDKNWTLEQVFDSHATLPFARMPIYDGDLDHISGVVRRRDLLNAMAHDKDNERVSHFQQEALFVPEHATTADVLGQFLKNQQQLAIVVDEFGSMSGVLSMEDIFEHILGQEIFEKDDVAIDMRAFALQKKRKRS